MGGVLGASLCTSLGEGPMQQNERLLFVGDSITDQVGYVEAIRSQLPTDVEISRLGLSGGRARDLWTGVSICDRKPPYRDVLASFQPTVVFLFIGINDAWHEPATPLAEYSQTLAELVQASGAIVVLATPALLGERRVNPKDDLVEAYAARSRQVAQEQGIGLCDLRSIFRTELARCNRWNRKQGVFTTDGVHMNRRGSELIAKAAWTSIADALQVR
jgi:isoamyl acetate esterase